MIKISHEVPIELFNYSLFFNDYPYCLAHLLMEDTKHYNAHYSAFYKRELSRNKFSILDNSLFELGDSIDYDVLYKLGEEYKPTHLILPDCMNNQKVTLERAKNYQKKYEGKSHPKFIGVLQGSSYEEMIELIHYYNTEESISLIAIPFHLGVREMEGPYNRFYVINELFQRVSFRKLIHLLGCYSPLEFKLYNVGWKEYIHSVDTSAPIIYGWNNVSLESLDLNTPKPKEKLAENLFRNLNQQHLDQISDNVKIFRNWLT
jgi:queuine/archaeosine tRNA-ribosyltransferase